MGQRRHRYPEGHRPPKGAWYEEKFIRGYGPYLYLRWIDEKGTRRSKYLGKVKKAPTANIANDSEKPQCT